MNICFLSQEYPPETHVGGIGTYTYNMASALAKIGHTVHVITSTQNHSHTFKDSGVWVHRIKKYEIIPLEFDRLIYSYLVSKKISTINCQFDIVHASEYANEAFWFSLNKKCPLVTRLATPFYLIEKLNGKMFFGPRPLFNWMEKKQTINSNGIFSSTKVLAKTVAENWGIESSRVTVIPNSVNVSHIVKLGENIPPPDILESKDFMVYFGRLEERKGVRVLAQALPAVFELFPSLNMVFVGSDLGYQGASMKEYIIERSNRYKDRLFFYDNLPQEDLFPIVNLSKLVVLPSIWEAFGFVCVEAMALGRPVIASSGSGFEEIIEDGISGFLVEPGNSTLLAQKIIICLRDEEKLRRISEGARKRAEDFEVTKVALRLLDYYEKTQEDFLNRSVLNSN